MDLISLDDAGRLYLAPDIDDWAPVEAAGITAVIDLDGGLDIGVPTAQETLYIYFPFNDSDLPNLDKLHAVGRLGATLIQTGHRVLAHCGLGFNRSALVAGVILTHLGLSGGEAVELLRRRRPGALYNRVFAEYLLNYDPDAPARRGSAVNEGLISTDRGELRATPSI